MLPLNLDSGSQSFLLDFIFEDVVCDIKLPGRLTIQIKLLRTLQVKGLLQTLQVNGFL